MGSIISSKNDKQFDSLKKKYFNSINQIVQQHYDNCVTPKRLNTNMSICFDNKYFDEIYSTEEVQNNTYIYWLQYLYNYLSIDLRDKEWAQEMLIFLEKEQFLSENKYLSHFFYKEFFMNSEPSCMRDPKNDISINNDIYEEPSLELRTSINNSNLNMMRALGGSIGPNAIIDDGNDNDINISINEAVDSDSKYKSYRNKVKKYIEIFRQHITYKDHPINKVIQLFEKTWVKYIKKQLDRISNKDQSLEEKAFANNLIDNLTREFQNFIIKVQICLKLFYCRAINYSCFVNEKDELMNLITTLFFKTGKIYETTFELLKIKLSDEIDDMNNKYKELINITPQQLGIKKQFCLNEVTLNFQESILEKEKKNIEENLKKESEGIKTGHNLDLNNNGVAHIYFNDDQAEKKKIEEKLIKIKEMKKFFPKNFSFSSNNVKVDIDFNRDDNNLLPESIFNKPSFINEEGLINSILPKNPQETMDLDYEYQNPNIEKRITFAPNIISTNNISTNLVTNDNSKETLREMENVSQENEIIRDNTTAEGRKTIAPFNFIKVFNCVKFTKDPNNTSSIRYPYETAIHLLKQIEKYKAPFEKMLIFANLGNEITNCVNDFWKDMEDFIKNDLLGIEAEQLMTIFIFILLKTQINDMLVHCKLIQLFTTSVIKSSMVGYYYSNAEASVSYIQKLKNVKELLKGNIDVFNDNNNDE